MVTPRWGGPLFQLEGILGWADGASKILLVSGAELFCWSPDPSIWLQALEEIVQGPKKEAPSPTSFGG